MDAQQAFLEQLGIQYPIIGGPMYPCSNPELVAAVSEAGGIGILQPISLTYVHGYEFRAGLQYIRELTSQPIGMNVLIEKSSKKYRQRMEQWIDIALDEGIRFFVTSLGKPDWVVDKVHAKGGLVYHDASEKKWADIGAKCGVDGLICVNNRAGGHAGDLSEDRLFNDLKKLGLPLVCAGGLSSADDIQAVLNKGYAAVQLGTRFIASKECTASEAYKQAILNADEEDIVLTHRLTGIPVSIINNGDKSLELSSFEHKLFNHKVFKRWMRLFYGLSSLKALKSSHLGQSKKTDYYPAGKSVQYIQEVLTCDEIVKQLML